MFVLLGMNETGAIRVVDHKDSDAGNSDLRQDKTAADSECCGCLHSPEASRHRNEMMTNKISAPREEGVGGSTSIARVGFNRSLTDNRRSLTLNTSWKSSTRKSTYAGVLG